MNGGLLDQGLPSDDHLPLDRRVTRLLRVDEVVPELSCLPMRPFLPSLDDDEALRGSRFFLVLRLPPLLLLQEDVDWAVRRGGSLFAFLALVGMGFLEAVVSVCSVVVVDAVSELADAVEMAVIGSRRRRVIFLVDALSPFGVDFRCLGAISLFFPVPSLDWFSLAEVFFCGRLRMDSNRGYGSPAPR